MEENFTNIADKIDKRRSAIIEALTKEAEAISEAEATLKKSYKDSVKGVCDGLINNMEEQGNELFKDYKKSNNLLRKSIIKTRRQFLQILLPTALLIGVIIGILVTLYWHQPQVMIDPSKIAKSEDGTQFYPVAELRTATADKNEIKE